MNENAVSLTYMVEKYDISSHEAVRILIDFKRGRDSHECRCLAMDPERDGVVV